MKVQKEKNKEKNNKNKKEINEIVFYGQDWTPICDAYFAYRESDSDASNPKQIKDEKDAEVLQEILWSFLQEQNKYIDTHIGDKNNSDVIIVGKSDNDISWQNNDKDKYLLSYMNDYNNEQEFGDLVGTIRRKYKKGAIDKDSEFYKSLIRNKEQLKKSEEKSEVGWKRILSKLLPKQGKSSLEPEIQIKVEIYSRFDRFDIDSIKNPKPYFLTSLLSKGNLNFNHVHNVDFSFDSLFDFYMLWQMKKHLADALLKGFFKKYQRFEGNDERPRGSIDIARHLRLNIGLNNGKVAYSYRENSLDNMVNHLILTAYDYLSEKYPGLVSDNFDAQQVRDLNNLKYEIGYPKYDRRTVITKNNAPVSHPYYNEYRELQSDCLMILRDEGLSPFGNNHENVSGILYYVPDLWEEYLEYYIRNEIMKRNKGKQYGITVAAQETIYVMCNLAGEKGHETRPDFVFRYKKDEKEVPFYIADAKYRKGWPKALKGKLPRKLMGDYDKCNRDMVSINGNATSVIFPVKEKELKEIERNGNLQYAHQFSKENTMTHFYTFPVEVPDVEKRGDNKLETFGEWNKKMHHSLEKAMAMVNDSLNYEADRSRQMNELLKNLFRWKNPLS